MSIFRCCRKERVKLKDYGKRIAAMESSVFHGGKRLNSSDKTDCSPVLSIITVVYNDAKGVKETIESVMSIHDLSVEHIIIDGGSSDGTVNVLRDFSDKVDYWISEQDDGMYDAMNKGISFSLGRYCWFINAGDRCLRDGIIDLLKSNLGHSGVISCPVMLRSDTTERVYAGNKTRPHQGLIYSLDLLHHLGGYDSQYKLISDRLLYDKVVKFGADIFIYEKPIAAFYFGGVSMSSYGRRLSVLEFLCNVIKNPSSVAMVRLIKSLMECAGAVKQRT